jgi:diadenosine tetraphosphatase ApaH/serine/threonine PP2A family protein phosphatase
LISRCVTGNYAEYILTGGHTHLQQIRLIGHNFFFNPGSIGLAFSHQARHFLFSRVDYAILTSTGATVSVEFRRVPYDIDALVHMYRASGRPYAEELIADYEAGGT